MNKIWGLALKNCLETKKYIVTILSEFRLRFGLLTGFTDHLWVASKKYCKSLPYKKQDVSSKNSSLPHNSRQSWMPSFHRGAKFNKQQWVIMLTLSSHLAQISASGCGVSFSSTKRHYHSALILNFFTTKSSTVNIWCNWMHKNWPWQSHASCQYIFCFQEN
jgi:hypothetical protein